MKNQFGITEKVYKISNSIDIEQIIAMGEEKIKFPKVQTFTIMGRLDKNKSQMLALRSAKKLKEYKNKFKILILGEGEEKDNLQKYINENELKDNVEIIGFKENIYATNLFSC